MSLAAAAQPESRTLGLSVTAEGAHEIVGARISYQYCRASTRLAGDGAHFLASLSSVPPGECPVDANPHCGKPLGGGQSVGEVVTGWVGEVSDRPPVTYTCSSRGTIRCSLSTAAQGRSAALIAPRSCSSVPGLAQPSASAG